MKTKLIQTKDYLLLVDKKAKIKEGDIALHNFGMGYDLEIPCDKDNLKSNTRFKVIAFYPLTKEVKELDMPCLPNPFKEIDVEELAFEKYPVSPQKRRIFIEGYKAAQSKQFSLGDIQKAFEAGVEWKRNPNVSELDAYTNLVQSLSTQQLPKEFIPEYEDYEVVGERDEDGYPLWSKRLKTITNSEGKEELVGTYKY